MKRPKIEDYQDPISGGTLGMEYGQALEKYCDWVEEERNDCAETVNKINNEKERHRRLVDDFIKAMPPEMAELYEKVKKEMQEQINESPTS